MAKSQIEVRLLGDNRDLARSLRDSEDKIGKFGSLAKGALLAGGGIFAADQLFDAGKAILNTGAELEALGNKSKTVFEGSLGDVQKWAAQLGPDLGMTQERLVGTAAGFADLLKPMGFTAEQAAGMSTDILDLSGALSAWTGGQRSASEVSDILSKAMLGERDGLKALGISIQEADVQAKLAEKGQTDLTGAALQQAKALATQELIFEKSTDAQKAWADGSQDAIKQQNQSKVAVENLKETLIKGIYPALQGLVPHITAAAQWVGERLPGAIATVKEAITAARPTIERVFNAIREVAETVVVWFQQNWPDIQARIQEFVAWLEANVLPVVRQIVAFLIQAFADVKAWMDENWPAIKETIASTLAAIQVVVETVTKAISVIWELWGDDILRFLEKAWTNVKAIIDAALTVVRGLIQTVTSLIRGDWQGVWDGIKTILDGAWKAIQALVKQALAVLELSLGAAWSAIKALAATAWEGLKSTVKSAIDGLVGFVRELPGRFLASQVAMAQALLDLIEAPFREAKNEARGAIDDVVGFVRGLPDRLRGLVTQITSAGRSIGSAVIDGIISGLSSAASVVGNVATAVSNAVRQASKDAANGVIDRLNNALEFRIEGPGWLPDININPPDIPRFHSGGIVRGVGSEIPILAQPGEGVFTREQMAAMGGGGLGVGDRLVLVVEGTPLTAIVQRRDSDLVAALSAGVR